MRFCMGAFQLLALTESQIRSGIRHALESSSERRPCGGRAPSWAVEERAQRHLIQLGMMQGLVCCFLSFFLVAHGLDDLGRDLMRSRMLLRSTHRPQAMGMSGIGVDLDLGLRWIIEAKFGVSLEVLHAKFMEGVEDDRELWSQEQVCRHKCTAVA